MKPTDDDWTIELTPEEKERAIAESEAASAIIGYMNECSKDPNHGHIVYTVIRWMLFENLKLEPEKVLDALSNAIGEWDK